MGELEHVCQLNASSWLINLLKIRRQKECFRVPRSGTFVVNCLTKAGIPSGNQNQRTRRPLRCSENHSRNNRKEGDQKALDKAEKKRWESRKDWVNRFSFESTHHPKITFDPTVFNLKNKSERNGREKRKTKPTGI